MAIRLLRTNLIIFCDFQTKGHSTAQWQLYKGYIWHNQYFNTKYDCKQGIWSILTDNVRYRAHGRFSLYFLSQKCGFIHCYIEQRTGTLWWFTLNPRLIGMSLNSEFPFSFFTRFFIRKCQSLSFNGICWRHIVIFDDLTDTFENYYCCR